jgi:hypothetical protein
VILGSSRPGLGLNFLRPVLPRHVGLLRWFMMRLTAMFSCLEDTMVLLLVILGSSRPGPGLSFPRPFLPRHATSLRWFMMRLTAMSCYLEDAAPWVILGSSRPGPGLSFPRSALLYRVTMLQSLMMQVTAMSSSSVDTPPTPITLPSWVILGSSRLGPGCNFPCPDLLRRDGLPRWPMTWPTVMFYSSEDAILYLASWVIRGSSPGYLHTPPQHLSHAVLLWSWVRLPTAPPRLQTRSQLRQLQPARSASLRLVSLVHSMLQAAL